MGLRPEPSFRGLRQRAAGLNLFEGGTVVAQDTTNSDGNYLVQDIAAGTYLAEGIMLYWTTLSSTPEEQQG